MSSKDKDKAEASYRSIKGHFSRTVSEAKAAIENTEEAINDASAHDSEYLQSMLHDIRQHASRVEAKRLRAIAALEGIAEIDPNDHATCEQRITELSHITDGIKKTIEDTAKTLQSVIAAKNNASVAAPGSGGARPRAAEALKPPELEASDNAVELRQWIKAYRAYHEASNFNAAPLHVQHSYMEACLSTTMKTRLAAKITPTTPVLGESNSCMAIIQAEFMKTCPLIKRRFQFFAYKQEPGMAAIDFAAKLDQLEAEADIASLSCEEFKVMKFLQGTTDHEIRRKIMEIDRPTWADIDKHIAAATMSSATFGRGAAAAAASAGNSKVGNRRPKNPKIEAKLSEFRSKNICFRCGERVHGAGQACPGKNHTCNKCQRKGHREGVCLKSMTEKLSNTTASAKAIEATNQEPPPYESDEEDDLGSCTRTIKVRQISGLNEPTPKVAVYINAEGKRAKIMALPDTGATRTIISASACARAGIEPDPARRERISVADGNKIHCAGAVVFMAICKDAAGATAKAKINALVSNDLADDCLLSWRDLQRLHIIPSNFPAIACKAASTNGHTHQSIADLVKEYDDVFDLSQGITPMKGDPMTIEVDRGGSYRPRKVTTARATPLHYKEAAEKEIELLVNSEVIEPVAHVTEWVSPAFFVPKPKGGVRLVVDYSNLNRHTKRPVHPFPSPLDVVRSIKPTSRYFLTFDFVSGYFQVPLEESSRDLATFLLPSGKYRPKSAPMGLNISSDVFCQRSDAALAGVPDLIKIVDDGLLQAEDEAAMVPKFKTVLEACRRNSLTLSRPKLQWGREVEFAGHVISAEGIKADPRKIEALAKFPAPTNVPTLRSFLGLANQLGFFIPDLAHMTTNMRQLLKKERAWTWTDMHQTEFEAVIKALTSDMVVKAFNPNKETVLLTDASRLCGLGYALVQRNNPGDDKSFNLVMCGSRTLTPAETRYSTFEIEAKAVQYAVTQCRHFLLGCPRFAIYVDHRPLVGAFSKPLEEIVNKRVLAYRESLAEYNFDVIWVQGKDHFIADMLSRNPHFHPQKEEEEDDDEVGATACLLAARDPAFDGMVAAANADESYKAIRHAIEKGIAAKAIPGSSPARVLIANWDNLSIEHSLIILNGSKIFVPKPYRSKIIHDLHRSHAGYTRTISQARASYYWPTMVNDIKQAIDNCEMCQVLRPSQPEDSMRTKSMPDRPMASVSADLFQLTDKHYLVLVDRFSGFPFVSKLTNTRSSTVVMAVRAIAEEFGYPAEFISDNGPQFTGEAFQTFCRDNAILHVTSSPHHPRSNGHAEAAVKNMKLLLRKYEGNMERFRTALLYWRNTPRAAKNCNESTGSNTGKSPAELFFKRPLRSGLPTLATSFGGTEDKLPENMHPKLEVGTAVRLQDPVTHRWDTRATIISMRDSGRSYEVRVDNEGPLIIRNRRFIKKCKPITVNSDPDHATASTERETADLEDATAGQEAAAAHSSGGGGQEAMSAADSGRTSPRAPSQSPPAPPRRSPRLAGKQKT